MFGDPPWFILRRFGADVFTGFTITACTVLQAVVKANSQSDGKGQIWTVQATFLSAGWGVLELSVPGEWRRIMRGQGHVTHFKFWKPGIYN